MMSEKKSPYLTEANTTSWPYPNPATHKSIPRTWMVNDQIIYEEPQARFVDISFWYRTGGIDWARLRDAVDGVIIRAGQGYYGIDALLKEHIDKSVEFGVPYHTYWQFDPRQAIDKQMQDWLDGYGVAGHKMCLAIERTGGGHPTAGQCDNAFTYLFLHVARKDVYGYSRVRYLLEELHRPDCIDWVKWIIAQYPYEDYYTSEQYRQFQTYLDDHAYELPKDMNRTGAEDIECVAHQFTSRLDAQLYFANAYTDDPEYAVGLKNGDGIVSMGQHSDAVKWFVGDVEPDPEPEPDPELTQRVIVLENNMTDVLKRLDALESAEPADPEPEPERETVHGVVVGEEGDKLVAYYDSEPNKKGKPIMRKYEPVIRFELGEELTVYPELVDADGDVDYHQIYMTSPNRVTLYCRADRIEL